MKMLRIICAALGLGISLQVLAASQDEEGYFLPWSQKGNLIWQGAVEGDDGTWYDIRIVPGYTPPGRYGWKYIKTGGRNMREYVESDKYKNLREQSGEVLEWSYDDCLQDFTFKGAGKAWKKYYGKANARTDKRVFGWWLSYPWATLQGCVDNVVRIPVGLVGTAVGTGWGVAVVPAYHAVDSGVKAVWNTGARGCIVPITGWTWNTVASPPLSLVGQMPSIERVDGFWVRVVEEGMKPGREPDRQAKVDVAEWGVLLYEEFKVYENQRQAIDREKRNKLRELETEKRLVKAEAVRRNQAVESAEKDRIESLRADGESRELATRIHEINWTKNSVRYYREDILAELRKQGLDEAERNTIMRILERDLPFASKPPAYQKTDPVIESVQVIKDIE